MNHRNPAPEPESHGLALPAGREAFRVWEVAKILNHSKDQINDLIDLGELGPVIDCARPGASRSSRIITRAGLEKFLKKRAR